jgi:hypothetical protein
MLVNRKQKQGWEEKGWEREYFRKNGLAAQS